MKPLQRWLSLALIALLAIAAGYLTVFSEKQLTSPPPETGIFNLTLADTEGRPQAFAQWRGRILILNYWATWCFPCKEEMPGFARIQAKLGDKGIQFVGISTDDADKIAEFLKQTPINYPLLIGDMKIMADSAKLGNSRQALPFTAVFDREGRLAMTRLGRWSESDLEPLLRELATR